MVEYLKNLPQVPKNPIDGDYTGQNFADAIRGILRAEVEVVKQNELHTFSVFPKHYWKSPVQYINVFIQYGEVF